MSNILTGAASTVAGFSSVAFNLDKALAILGLMERQGVSYGLGCKAVPLAASPPTYARPDGSRCEQIDCSGFHRYVLYHAAGGVTAPDGSFTQCEWYDAQGFKRHDVPGPNSAVYLQGMAPGYVYACFCKTGARGETIGHTWFCAFINGGWWTLESHGGKGPSSRPHDTPVLARICTTLFPIAKVS
jgi:hypothetical protein